MGQRMFRGAERRLERGKVPCTESDIRQQQRAVCEATCKLVPPLQGGGFHMAHHATQAGAIVDNCSS